MPAKISQIAVSETVHGMDIAGLHLDSDKPAKSEKASGC